MSSQQQLTKKLDVYKQLAKYVNWDLISTRDDLTESFIWEFQRFLNIERVILNCNVSTEFVDKIYIDWDRISPKDLREVHYEKFKLYLNWDRISRYGLLTEDIIRKFSDYFIWSHISRRQKLSEIFIKEFQNHVDWGQISEYQTLSEDFIREFKDSVVWNKISKYQNLSEEFASEFEVHTYW
jgi:hypothetical protein